MDDATQQEILADIVGVKEPDHRQLSLVNAVDTADFDAKLAALAESWNELEKRVGVFSQVRVLKQSFILGKSGKRVTLLTKT